MKHTAIRLFPLLISACLLLSSCSPHNTMLKTAKLSAGDIDSISYLSNIASVSLTEEEQIFMIRILDKARITEADPSEEGAGAAGAAVPPAGRGPPRSPRSTARCTPWTTRT